MFTSISSSSRLKMLVSSLSTAVMFTEHMALDKASMSEALSGGSWKKLVNSPEAQIVAIGLVMVQNAFH